MTLGNWNALEVSPQFLEYLSVSLFLHNHCQNHTDDGDDDNDQARAVHLTPVHLPLDISPARMTLAPSTTSVAGHHHHPPPNNHHYHPQLWRAFQLL